MSSLTPAQLSFARKHGATPGCAAEINPRSVFFYRKTEIGAERWLVDADGRILDQAWFRNSCAA
jgi:hypothetical protein